jgi:hypothetical protein
VFNARVFTIWTSRDIATLQANVASWPVPSVAVVRGTLLGAADFTFYYPSEAIGRFAMRDGKPDYSRHIPPDQWRTLRADDQFDAVLYPGSEPSAVVPGDPARCADQADINEHLRRTTIGGPPQLADQLKQFCAAVESR